MKEDEIKYCPYCGGAGFTEEVRAVCCGRGQYECCGDPDPEYYQEPCQACQTTGLL